jgi:hypothetical protein
MENDLENRRHEMAPLKWALLQFGLSVVLVLGLGGKLIAQSCAMCYTTAAAGGSGIIHALKGGILVLLFPAVSIFVGLIVLIFRWQSASS